MNRNLEISHSYIYFDHKYTFFSMKNLKKYSFCDDFKGICVF